MTVFAVRSLTYCSKKKKTNKKKQETMKKNSDNRASKKAHIMRSRNKIMNSTLFVAKAFPEFNVPTMADNFITVGDLNSEYIAEFSNMIESMFGMRINHFVMEESYIKLFAEGSTSIKGDCQVYYSLLLAMIRQERKLERCDSNYVLYHLNQNKSLF